MAIQRCGRCNLPTRIHFAFCWESGIKADMPSNALSPNAIVFEPGELRQPRLSEWLAKNGKAAK